MAVPSASLNCRTSRARPVPPAPAQQCAGPSHSSVAGGARLNKLACCHTVPIPIRGALTAAAARPVLAAVPSRARGARPERRPAVAGPGTGRQGPPGSGCNPSGRSLDRAGEPTPLCALQLLSRLPWPWAGHRGVASPARQPPSCDEAWKRHSVFSAAQQPALVAAKRPETAVVQRSVPAGQASSPPAAAAACRRTAAGPGSCATNPAHPLPIPHPRPLVRLAS